MLAKNELAMPKSTRPWSEVQKEIPQEPHMGIQWFAVHCSGAPDKRVETALQRVGWEVYFPKTRELKPVPKRKLTVSQRNSHFPVMSAVEVTLFPRYPFLRFDPLDPRRHDVFELLGVHGMLCDGSGNKPQPAPISDLVVAALRAQEIGGVIPAHATIKQLIYDVGEQVRIRGGVFAGHNAEVFELPDVKIEALDANHRLKLLLTLFGRQTIVELSIGDLEKL